MTLEKTTLDWLLDSDPALRWQVERDVVGAPEQVWQATRARVATEGFGAQLLAKQDEDGQWAGGAYFPAGFFESAERDAPGQPWTATRGSPRRSRWCGRSGRMTAPGCRGVGCWAGCGSTWMPPRVNRRSG